MMKRIIAAALSVLVGAFGYNIVDKALEDRVATLESEVVELQDEVSRHHRHTTLSGSEVLPTTEDIYFPTEGYTEILVGDYLTEIKGSIRKFLIREYPYSEFEYIPHYIYEPVSFYSRQMTATNVHASGDTTYFYTHT